MAAAFKEPLLSNDMSNDMSNDLEAPPAPPTATTPWSLHSNLQENKAKLKQRPMTWAELGQFFLDPANRTVLLQVALTAACVLAIMFDQIIRSKSPGNLTPMREVACAATLGLASISYTAYLAKQLEHQVGLFKKNIGALDTRRAELKDSLGVLEGQVKTMREQVGMLANVKDQMAALGGQSSGAFSKIMDDAKREMDLMIERLKDDKISVFRALADGMEMMDHQSGLSEAEYMDFCSEIKKYVGDFKPQPFAEVAVDDVVDRDALQAMCDNIRTILKPGGLDNNVA